VSDAWIVATALAIRRGMVGAFRTQNHRPAR